MSMQVFAEVERDATLSVREVITVLSGGREIQHGIIRVFPTDYRDDRGAQWRTDFQLGTVMLNGKSTPVQTKRVGRNLEIRIGNPDVLLRPGMHVFEISYRTRGWVTFRDSADELIWNVTGNEWSFPIEAASYRLALPDGAAIVSQAAFTGKKGATGASYVLEPDGSFRTSKRLALGEGLTVAVSWEKGFVAPLPTGVVTRVSRFAISRSAWMMIGLLLFVFAYYFAAWLAVGRDPEKLPLIPLYRPPNDVEPGFANYLKHMEFTSDALAADLVHLAVLGFVRFEERDGQLWLFPTEPTKKASEVASSDALPKLPATLEGLLATIRIGPSKHGFSISEANGDVLHRASERLRMEYESRAKRYFMSNKIISWLGLCLLVPFGLLSLTRVGALAGSAFVVLGRTGQAAILFAPRRWTRRVFVAIMCVMALIVAIDLLLLDWVVFGSFLTALAVAIFFSRIMPARTKEGARLAAEIGGLEMYMGTAERYRLAMLYRPDETPELFESLLPYAYALGCADTWVNSFAYNLKKASYRPEWNGLSAGDLPDWNYFSMRMSRSMTGELRSSIETFKGKLANRRAANSGSGGGFSGGGGGGGGGRGW